MNTIKHSARSSFAVGALLLAVLAFAGCGKDNEPAAHQTPARTVADAPVAQNPAATPTEAETIAGVTFTPPKTWANLGPSGMRQAQYRSGPVKGDADAAEVNVFYFGPQSGGGVEANLQRWIGQMVLPDGADPQSAARHAEFTADAMAGHIVSLNGSYKSGGGRPMGGAGQLMEGYRLVGVVLEGLQGSLFFKLTGPLASAEAMESDLMAMVKAAHK